jgi:hypothetical protein
VERLIPGRALKVPPHAGGPQNIGLASGLALQRNGIELSRGERRLNLLSFSHYLFSIN